MSNISHGHHTKATVAGAIAHTAEPRRRAAATVR